MSKTISYLDWELTFKKGLKSKNSKIKMAKKVKVNSIGISDKDFKSFLNDWKDKNL